MVGVVIGGTEQGTVEFWRISDGTKLATLADLRSLVVAVAVTRDTMVVSGSLDGEIRVSDLDRRVGLASFRTRAAVTSLRACGGSIIVAGDDSGAVTILEYRD